MIWIKETITKLPSFSRFSEHIEVVEQNVISNPSLCVETSKALVEGICKTILKNKNIEYNPKTEFNVLVKTTISAVLNVDDTFKSEFEELGRRIASVSQQLGEIRTKVGFATHGMDILNPRLTNTLSIFASKVADTIGGFILNCYINNRTVNTDHRLHFKDCINFNEYFDNLNPIQFGSIDISASEALFSQDYEAYREAYLEYLDSLNDELEEV